MKIQNRIKKTEAIISQKTQTLRILKKLTNIMNTTEITGNKDSYQYVQSQRDVRRCQKEQAKCACRAGSSCGSGCGCPSNQTSQLSTCDCSSICQCASNSQYCASNAGHCAPNVGCGCSGGGSHCHCSPSISSCHCDATASKMPTCHCARALGCLDEAQVCVCGPVCPCVA